MLQRTIACCLFEGRKVHSFSRVFSPEWVERLYCGFLRSIPVSRVFSWQFVCLVDRPYSLPEAIKQVPLIRPRHDYFDLLQVFRLPGQVLFCGLDTVVTGDPSPLLLSESRLALLEDVYRDEWSTSVMLFSRQAHIWEAFSRHGPGRARTEQEWLSDRIAPDRIQSLYPGLVKSWKAEVQSEGIGDARLVYFHGKVKPHNVGGELQQRWQLRQPAYAWQC